MDTQYDDVRDTRTHLARLTEQVVEAFRQYLEDVRPADLGETVTAWQRAKIDELMPTSTEVLLNMALEELHLATSEPDFDLNINSPVQAIQLNIMDYIFHRLDEVGDEYAAGEAEDIGDDVAEARAERQYQALQEAEDDGIDTREGEPRSWGDYFNAARAADEEAAAEEGILSGPGGYRYEPPPAPAKPTDYSARGIPLDPTDDGLPF